jgi:hypothetical protein
MPFVGPWNSRHQTHTGCAKKKVYPESKNSSYFGACLVINLHPDHCKVFKIGQFISTEKANCDITSVSSAYHHIFICMTGN